MMRSRFRFVLSHVVFLAVMVPAVADGIPPSLRDIVLGAGHRPIVEIELHGLPFEGLAPFSDVAYLLWPLQDPAVAFDRDRAAAWIRSVGADLGHRDFEPRFAGQSAWRGNEVWTYRLERQGIPLHDARVLLHWRDGRLIGLVNDLPLPIEHIEEAVDEPGERVYSPRRGETGYTLRLADVVQATEAGRRVTAIRVADETVQRIVEPLESRSAATATIEEWPVPAGSFPDQIDIDSSGVVWFSQPNQNWVTSFDPVSEIFTQVPTTGGSGPDGMMVDSNDVLWTGLYFVDSGLGRYDIATSTFTTHPAPYLSAEQAIPNETTAGTIWITDHRQNRISEFHPASGSWLQSLVMPTPDCWVVGGTEDPVTQDVYFTEFNVDQLGRKTFAGPILDIPVPAGSGPAFAAYSDGRVYFSEWNRGRLGVYDISSGSVTEYLFPEANEPGGPIDATPDGLIAVGTRNAGFIMVFDPTTETFESFGIPTPNSELKDGLRSDGEGRIWFTESGPANRIAILDLDGLPSIAEFSAEPTAGTVPLGVDFTDLSTNVPLTWSWEFGDAGTSDAQNPTHVYTDPGRYSVSLTVRDGFNVETERKVNYIRVGASCALQAGDVTIAGRRQLQNAVFEWGADPNCHWAVHRAVDPSGILSTPPAATLEGPVYQDVLPVEPLVFYNVAPMDEVP